MFFLRGRNLDPVVVVNPKKMTIHDQFHSYTQDIRDLKQLENRQAQKVTLLNNNPNLPARSEAQAELERLQKMIEVAEKTIIKLIEREERINPGGGSL